MRRSLSKFKGRGLPPGEVHDWIARYERYTALTCTRHTAVRYSKALQSFFELFPDRTKVTDFTAHDIEDYRLAKLDEGVKPSTVNLTVRIVGLFFKYLIDSDVIAYNPCSRVRSLKEREPERKSLSLDQQEQLYRSVNEYGTLQQRLLVGLALSTGLRGDTLAQLETTDVDFEGSALRIPAAKMKAGRNHTVPLRDTELELIRQLPPGRLFEGFARDVAGLRHQFNRIVRRAGLPLRGLHMARRTFATTLLRSGADLKTVQDLLAHKSVATTSKYFTPADEQTCRTAITKLPAPQKQEVV